jgi:protein phosphatase
LPIWHGAGPGWPGRAPPGWPAARERRILDAMRSPCAVRRWTAALDVPAGARRWRVTLGTDQGARRHVNEDAVVADAALRLVVVLDGVGGISSGARAATLAADGVVDALAGAGAPRRDAERVRAALHAGGARLADAAAADPGLRGSGAAAVAALLGPEGATLAHVGDCRALRWRAGALTALTRDHDLARAFADHGATSEQVAEVIARHPTVITSALGLGPPATVDVAEVALAPGDRLVLVTDGVHRLLDAAALAAALAAAPDVAVAAILDDVAARGGDNAAIAIIDDAP